MNYVIVRVGNWALSEKFTRGLWFRVSVRVRVRFRIRFRVGFRVRATRG